MTTNIQSTTRNDTFKGAISRLIWVFPLAVLLATAANLGLYYAAGILFPMVTAWPGAGPGQIAGANFVYLLVGAAIFAVSAWLSANPARHFVIISVIGLLLSLGLPISAAFGYGPPGTPPAGAATAAVLSLMHLVSFTISVPLFVRLALFERK